MNINIKNLVRNIIKLSVWIAMMRALDYIFILNIFPNTLLHL